MKRTWTVIGVANVAASHRWYQRLFGHPESPPAHSYFGTLQDEDGTMLLCLHEWSAHDHPTLASPDRATPGNGLLLFFRVDDFDASLQRARPRPCAGGRAPPEPQHPDHGIRAARPGWLLRHGQRARLKGSRQRIDRPHRQRREHAMHDHLVFRFLLLSTLINYAVLIVWFLAFAFAHGRMRKLHGRWFKLPDATFDATHYGGMAAYKIGILLFNLVPLLALLLLRHGH